MTYDNQSHPSIPSVCHKASKSSKQALDWSESTSNDLRWPKITQDDLTTFWLHSDYILTTFWLHSDYILTDWLTDWLTDCYIYLRGSCSKTILEFFLHCLTASIEQWKCVCSCQLCFMHWSCSSFVTNLLCCMHWSRRRWRTCGFRVPVVRDGRKWTEGRR